MARRKTQIDKAIESLEAERAVLDAAISKLRQEQAKKPTVKRTSRVSAAPPAEAIAR